MAIAIGSNNVESDSSDAKGNVVMLKENDNNVDGGDGGDVGWTDDKCYVTVLNPHSSHHM